MKPLKSIINISIFNKVVLINIFYLFKSQEAEAFALYHKALDLQKHDRFEESAKAYHELLEIRLLREVSDLERHSGNCLLYFVFLHFQLPD